MMYYRISKYEKILFFGKKIAQVWAVTLNYGVSNIMLAPWWAIVAHWATCFRKGGYSYETAINIFKPIFLNNH